MKIPFRTQVSEYDCVPTSFTNALAFLFERHEIPPSVLQKIYLYTLDTFAPKTPGGHGTSSIAVKFLANYLGEVKIGDFRVEAQVYEGAKVHLREGNPISRCLNSGGAALLRVKDTGKDWHYILALRVSGDWVECYDPYQRKPRKVSSQFEISTPADPHGYNLRIHRNRLDTKSNKGLFCLGTDSERECVLLARPSTSK